MNLHLKKFNLADTLAVCRRLPRDEQEVYEALNGLPYSAEDVAASAHYYNGIHFIVHDGEAPVAVGGFVRQREGVFRTWFFASDDVWVRHGLPLTILVRNTIADTLGSGLAHRIETVTLADRSRARAWYERLGLKFESTLPGYGVNGEDAVLYVALRGPERL